MPKSDTNFSVSTAKAFFEAAKKPEVRKAAVAAAKNPFVRNVAKQAAANPDTRNQLIAALEKQFSAKSTCEKPKPPSKSKHEDVEPAPPPPPPPPHRNSSGQKIMPSGYSMTLSNSPSTCTSSLYSKSHITKSYEEFHPKTPASNFKSDSSNKGGSMCSSVVNALQNLQLEKPGKELPSTVNRPPATSLRAHEEFSSFEPHAIVKYSYTASHRDELSCVVDDIVILKCDVDDQWIYGKNSRTGAFGIIPISFLDIRVPLGSGSSSSSSGLTATAIYDYDSNTPGDLTFRMHEQIVVIERVGPDWLRGSLNGREGIFPANFVSCPNISSIPMSQAAAQSTSEKMIAVYDYSSEVQGDLEFKAGDLIEVVAPIDQDWICGRLNGCEGLAPLSYLAPHGISAKEPKKNIVTRVAGSGDVGQIVTAIADHYNDDPKMLCFSKGDRIVILEDVDAYWFRGKVQGFKTLPAGLFPKTVVETN